MRAPPVAARTAATHRPNTHTATSTTPPAAAESEEIASRRAALSEHIGALRRATALLNEVRESGLNGVGSASPSAAAGYHRSSAPSFGVLTSPFGGAANGAASLPRRPSPPAYIGASGVSGMWGRDDDSDVSEPAVHRALGGDAGGGAQLWRRPHAAAAPPPSVANVPAVAAPTGQPMPSRDSAAAAAPAAPLQPPAAPDRDIIRKGPRAAAAARGVGVGSGPGGAQRGGATVAAGPSADPMH